MRRMEVFILSLIAIVGLSFFIEIFLAKPDLGEISRGLVPSLPGTAALYVAIGIIGATVMPHNLYLHSALVQTRKIKRDEGHIRQALKLNLWDSTIALNLAFLVKCSYSHSGRCCFLQIRQNGSRIDIRGTQASCAAIGNQNGFDSICRCPDSSGSEFDHYRNSGRTNRNGRISAAPESTPF